MANSLSSNPRARVRLATALGAVAVFVLTACAAPADSAELSALRERFGAAGGSCNSWTTIDEPRSRGAIECDGGAKIFLFDSDTARSDLVKTELETNSDIRARTHIMLSGDYWLIIDTIATVVHVMPAMGGIIQGRNGANP